MRNLSLLLTTAVLLTAGTAHAQTQKPPPPVIAASSLASVEVHVNQRPIGGKWYAEDAALTGPARIAITYGQPHARGRKVEGGLIPKGRAWRFGANTATTLHTDVDLQLGDLTLPRGDFTLFILYDDDGWQLIANGQTGQWGTDYDASQDVGRVPLASRQMAERQESLSVYLVPDAAKPQTGHADLSGVLRIAWGTTELSTPWTVQQ